MRLTPSKGGHCVRWPYATCVHREPTPHEHYRSWTKRDLRGSGAPFWPERRVHRISILECGARGGLLVSSRGRDSSPSAPLCLRLPLRTPRLPLFFSSTRGLGRLLSQSGSSTCKSSCPRTCARMVQKGVSYTATKSDPNLTLDRHV